MRKNIDLSQTTIKKLKRLAFLEGRKLKPFIEHKLTQIALKSIVNQIQKPKKT